MGKKRNSDRTGFSPLGHRLQDWVDAEAGRSVAELARRIGISQPALRNWLFEPTPDDPKKGAPRSLGALIRIAEELGTTAELLMAGVQGLSNAPTDDEIDAVWDRMSKAERRVALRQLARSRTRKGAGGGSN